MSCAKTDKRPVIAYIATVMMPSSETETEQIIRSFEALHEIDPTAESVIPVARDRKTAIRSIQAYYQTSLDHAIRTYRSIGPLSFEAERLINVFLAALRWIGRYDIIHTRSRGTILLAVLLRQKVCFETYRLLPQTNPIFFLLLRFLARSRNLLGVVCHSSQSMQALRDGGFPSAKLIVFRNGYVAKLFQPPVSRSAARDILGLPMDNRIASYAGNMQQGKGVEVLLQLAHSHPGILFTLVGGKRHHISRVGKLVRGMGLANIMLAGRLTPDKVALHLQAADILVIPPSSEPQLRYRHTLLPMKTFLYLGAGRPILAPDSPDLREVLTHAQNAWLVQPDVIEDSSSALETLLSDEALAARLAKAAAETAINFSWESRAVALRDWLISRASESALHS